MSTLLLMAGALAKAFPAVLVPLWLRRVGWPETQRGWGNALAGAAFAAICIWPYRSALAQLPATLDYYQSRWQNNNASLFALVEWFTGSPSIALGLGAGLVVGLALWAAARRLDAPRAAYLLIGAILLVAPNGYPWYFTWIVPFLCFFPNPAWLLLTILQFLSYHVLIDYQATGLWHFRPEMVWLTYAPFYALLVGEYMRRRQKMPT